MNNVTRRLVMPVVGSALVLGGLLFGSASGWVTLPAVQAQTPVPTVPPPGEATVVSAAPGTITVVGEGKVSIEPDIARVNIGVETVTTTVEEAAEQNRNTVEAVLSALLSQGVAEEDIQTSGFSIFAERYGPEGPLAESDVRYRVSNNVNVTIRDLEAVGTILDAAIAAGANNIYGVDFAVDDPNVNESEARSLAVEDAQAKAAELAELTGATLGNVVSISEVIGVGGGYYASNFAEQARAFGGGGAPIAPGQLELIMQLQVVYSLTPAAE
jgi:uncharacterized protein